MAALVVLLREIGGDGKGAVHSVLEDAAAEMVRAPAKPAGRKRHNWKGYEQGSDGQPSWTCVNCSLKHRTGWYEMDGRVVHVDQWLAPDERLLRVRWNLALDAPATAPSFDVAFAGVEEGGYTRVPERPRGVGVLAGVGAGRAVLAQRGPATGTAAGPLGLDFG